MADGKADGVRTEYGYGSVYQRESDGRWVAAVELPRAKGESRHRLVTYAPTREGAELLLAAYRADHPPIEHRGRAANMERARSLGRHTAGEWWRLVRECRGACFYCGARGLDFQQDHRTPVSRGGSDAIDNLVVACRRCNAEKGTMTVEEYVEWKTARAEA